MKLGLQWATRPCRGETANGDAVFVKASATRTVFAVIDALGHGPIAALAADTAVRFLDGVTDVCTAAELIAGVHTALRGTRGAGAMICVYENGTLDAAGVGNVALRVFGSRFDIAPTPGILGARIRSVRSAAGRLTAGARVIVYSDGVQRRAEFDSTFESRGAGTCERILRDCSIAHDDATVLVADVETQ